MIIVNEWIRLIHKECNIGTWSTCLDNGQSINVIISGPDCPYSVRVTQHPSNVHIELYRYEYKYTAKEVD